MVIKVFILNVSPRFPPVMDMLIILTVLTCTSILDAASGLKYVLQVVERVLINNPKRANR